MYQTTGIILILNFIYSSHVSSFIHKLCPRDTFDYQRDVLIAAENKMALGGDISLTEDEHLADKIFIQHKLAEIEYGYDNPDQYAPGMHFFNAKKYIDKSYVFKLIQKMPKGAMLHGHNSALVSSEWVISNLTYTPGVLMCKKDDKVVLSFRQKDGMKCTPVASARAEAFDPSIFDEELEKSINLRTPLPRITYSNVNAVWKKFQSIFNTVYELISYRPAFRAFHWRLMEEMHEDNVMYIELRIGIKKLYDENNNVYPPEVGIKDLISVVKDFKASHPNFLGIKAIIGGKRALRSDALQEDFNLYIKLHQMFPDFIIGFDLVGQEDTDTPLNGLLDVLTKVPPTVKLFFHAGETNRYGAIPDLNIIDAIMLKTTRIGHGYALLKHPLLQNLTKHNKIAIEVCPLSNQILNLVFDLRNHPAAFYFAENFPVVIAPDDPGFWDAKGMSYDFYYAFMSFAPNNMGLKVLKQLVLNSLRYSVLTEAEQERAAVILNEQWANFIKQIMY